MFKEPIVKKEMIIRHVNIGDKFGSTLSKKPEVHSKNPFKIKKPNLLLYKPKIEKILDGFYLLDKSGCDLPHEVITIRLSGNLSF